MKRLRAADERNRELSAQLDFSQMALKEGEQVRSDLLREKSALAQELAVRLAEKRGKEQRMEDELQAVQARCDNAEERCAEVSKRRDVLQAEEVEVARQVVAEQAQHDDAPAVLLRQWRLGPHLPERDGGKHRKREQHSEGDQSDCIDVVAIQQFGDDGFRGKQDGAGDGDRQAGDEGGAW